MLCTNNPVKHHHAKLEVRFWTWEATMPVSGFAHEVRLETKKVRFMVKTTHGNNELQHISRRLTGLCMKRPGLSFGIWGEPGIGKTHTVLALLRGAPCQTRTVHATQALEKILLQLPRPKKPTLWLERTLERIGKGETLETGMLNQALVALLAANAPIVLHVQDLHEASPERFEFFKQLTIAVGRTRGVGLMVTSRAQPPESFETIKLAPLNREESDVLLEAEVGAKLPSEALAWLFERAAGNPLFTLEFFRLLARQGSLWNDGQRWRFRTPTGDTMPVTVEALIEQVLHETANTSALENAIGAKAMLGLEASEQLWAEVAGLTLESLIVVKQELELRGVISDAEFVHPLFREVVLAQMPRNQRQGFARRALEVLKDDPRVAAQFVKDAGLENDEALGWFERASQAASDAGGQIQAALLKAKSVEYASGAQKGRLALEAARVLRQVNLVKSLELATIAADLLPDNIQAIDLLAKLFAIGRQASEVERTLERLPAEQRSGDVWLFRLLRLKTMMRDFAGILELWKAHPELHSRLSPDAAGDIAFALAQNNCNEEAYNIASKALKNGQVSPNDRSSLLNVLAILRAFQGNFAEAEVFFGQAVQILKQIGTLQQIAGALTNHASALRCLGRYREMMAEYQEAVQLYSELGDGQGAARNQSLVGGQLIELGEYEQAEELLQTSLKQLKQGAMDDFLIQCEGSLSGLYRQWGLPQSAILSLKHAQAALRYARTIGAPSRIAEALSYMAAAEIFAGDARKGLELAQEELGIALNIQQPEAIYGAQMARGTALFALRQSDAALEAFNDAEQQAIRMGLPLEIRKASLEIACITRNIDAAKSLVAWFEERGLMNGVNIALRYFPELSANSNQTPSTSNAESMLYLEVLGSMQATLEAQTTPVRGRKRQELLALLLEARISGRSEVSKLELIDKLYPDSDEIQANAGLRDVIYQIRSSLAESTLTTTTNGYALGNLKTDVESFLETGNTKLWRGIYLEGLTLETSDTVRESLYLALRTRAEALLETDPVEVIRVGRLLCEADPYDLEALRLTVLGLRSQQNHRSLSRFYDAARTRFLEIGEMLPDRWQDFLTPIGTSARC